jgi:hypothetical protein
MLAAVAGGIAAGPGCSSLGWPFCSRFVGWRLVCDLVGDAGRLSIGFACASARAMISSCMDVAQTRGAVAVAVASRAGSLDNLQDARGGLR